MPTCRRLRGPVRLVNNKRLEVEQTRMAAPATNDRTDGTQSVQTFISLRTRNYRLFAVARLFGDTGYFMSAAALNWLVLSISGNPTHVGLVGALESIPTVFLAIAGGVLADRFSKRGIVILSYAGWFVLTLLLAVLTLSGLIQVWHVMLIALGLGLVLALGFPAEQAIIPEMVPSTLVRNAVSLLASVTWFAALFGPALGGVLVGALGPGWLFLITAVGYCIPLLATARIRVGDLHTAPPAEAGQPRGGLWHVFARKDVFWPTLIVGMVGMFAGNVSITLAVLADSVFETGAAGYGLLSAIVAVGSIVGALIAARLRDVRLPALVVMSLVVCVMYLVSFLAQTELSFCIVLAGIGASAVLLTASANATVQVAVPRSMGGRAMGLFTAVRFGSLAIGALLVGYLNERFGPHAAMLIGGIILAAMTLLIGAGLTVGRIRSLCTRARQEKASS